MFMEGDVEGDGGAFLGPSQYTVQCSDFPTATARTRSRIQRADRFGTLWQGPALAMGGGGGSVSHERNSDANIGYSKKQGKPAVHADCFTRIKNGVDRGLLEPLDGALGGAVHLCCCQGMGLQQKPYRRDECHGTKGAQRHVRNAS